MPGKPTYRELVQRIERIELEARENRICQEALLQREAHYRIILETAPDSITVTTMASGRYVQVNTAFCRLSGYTREEVLGKTVFDLNLFADPIDRDQILHRLKTDGMVDQFDVRYRQKSGNIIDTILSARPIVFDGQDCLIAVVTDVSRLKQFSHRLKISEQRFKDLAELLPAAIFEIDTEGFITYSNPACFIQLQHTRKEFERGINALELVSTEDRKKAWEVIRKTLSGIDTGLSTFKVVRKDGKVFHALTRSTAIVYDEAPVGVRGFMIDISSLKKTETEKDHQINHLKQVLAGLQTPEAAITMCTACKKIKNEQGAWTDIDAYIAAHYATELHRSICPHCSRTAFPGYYTR